MHPEYHPYHRFTGPARIDKAVNSLLGLLEGISLDHELSEPEIELLCHWITDQQDVQHHHPFNELIPEAQAVIERGKFDEDAMQGLLWLCRRLRSEEYLGTCTAGVQQLHAIMAGIAADGIISEDELKGLQRWIADHEHLRTCWPFDEVESLVTSVMADGTIDEQEHELLLRFFTDFLAICDQRTVTEPLVAEDVHLRGMCAVCPEIVFPGSTFCFTGASSRCTRHEFESLVKERGGRTASSVTRNLDYLVIGADGNPCWAYACYGRKVEQAVTLRKEGANLLLVHENDFHDAIADSS